MREPRIYIRPAVCRQLSVRPYHREFQITEYALFARRRDLAPVYRNDPERDHWAGAIQRVIPAGEGAG